MTNVKPRNNIPKVQLELKNYARQRIQFFEAEFDEIIVDSLQSDEMKHNKEEIKKRGE